MNGNGNTAQQQRGKRKSPAQYKRLAKLLAEDTPVGAALVQAGWTETQARKGLSAVPDEVFKMLPPKFRKLIALGRDTDKDTRRHIVRGRLIKNALEGRDNGSMSAKILGSDRELAMWEPELNSGLIVLQPPVEVLRRKAELLGDTEPVNGSGGNGK